MDERHMEEGQNHITWQLHTSEDTIHTTHPESIYCLLDRTIHPVMGLSQMFYCFIVICIYLSIWLMWRHNVLLESSRTFSSKVKTSGNMHYNCLCPQSNALTRAEDAACKHSQKSISSVQIHSIHAVTSQYAERTAWQVKEETLKGT